MAFERNWVHRSKHTPWGGGTGAGEIVRYGVDWSGAAFVWAFGASAGGAAVITLVNQAAGTEGVSAVYDPDLVHPISGAIVGGTIITPLIAEAAFEGLAWGSDPDAAKVLHHDLLITPVGLPQRPECFGTLTIYPGIGD